MNEKRWTDIKSVGLRVHFTCAQVYPPKASAAAGPLRVWPTSALSPHRATPEIRLGENLLRLVYALRVGPHLAVDFN